MPEWLDKLNERYEDRSVLQDIPIAYDYLGGPTRKEWKKLYEGYDDNWTKYPKMGWDIGSFGINTLKDIAQFIPDVATDTFQYLAADKGDGWFPGLSQEQKYKLDAWAPFGLPSVYTKEQGGNPYRDPSIFDKYRKESADRAWNHLLTHEDKGGFMTDEKAEKIWKDVEDEVYWAKYARDNPEGSLEDFQDLQWEKFLEVAGRKHRKDILDYMETDIDRSLMEDYGIGTDKSVLSDSYEFGMFGDKKIPFTDQKIGGYAWEGDELIPYFNKEKQIIQDAHVLGDVVGSLGIRSPLKWLARQTSRGKPVGKGIMENVQRTENPGKYDWAQEWLNRRGG